MHIRYYSNSYDTDSIVIVITTIVITIVRTMILQYSNNNTPRTLPVCRAKTVRIVCAVCLLCLGGGVAVCRFLFCRCINRSMMMSVSSQFFRGSNKR